MHGAPARETEQAACARESGERHNPCESRERHGAYVLLRRVLIRRAESALVLVDADLVHLAFLLLLRFLLFFLLFLLVEVVILRGTVRAAR